MTETVDTIGPLWNIVIAIGVAVALIAWADWRQEKSDRLDPKQVQDLAARERKREQMRAATRDC